MSDLSARQQQVLDVIRAAMAESGVAPSYREIGEQLGIRSTNGVSDHVRALERKGYLERVGGRGAARSLSLTTKGREGMRLRGPAPSGQVVGVPVLGRIAAGIPIAAVEEHDNLLFIDRQMVQGGNVFALTVQGDSMIEDGILDGDTVFVRQQPDCRQGEIAAVLVDGEATVKRVFRERGLLRLEPSNASMQSIYVAPDVGECRIMGVVVGVYRQVH